MEKKTLLKVGQAICILAFAGFAMACGCSSQDAIKGVDDFVNGYNEGKALWSEVNLEEGDYQKANQDMAYEIPSNKETEDADTNE